ncbi:MAG: hypothetical protein DMG70_11860 [Acidobacteria bacterium]|nr:MAG: hypothetical protein DMG70_11860 [Acidobacteriota bacterium]
MAEPNVGPEYRLHHKLRHARSSIAEGTLLRGAHSRFAPLGVEAAESIPQRNHNWFILVPVEHQLQVTAVFHLRAELSELIRPPLDHPTAEIGKQDRHLTPNHFWLPEIH